MRIGVDIQAAKGKVTGLGVYAKCLSEALPRRNKGNHNVSFLNAKQDGDWNTIERLLWENWTLPKLAKENQIDLLHVTAYAPPFHKTCKLVVTVHDLIGMAFPNQLGWPSRLYWGYWLPQAVKKADRIIADSEHTKKDIIKFLKIPAGKIKVIYLAPPQGFKTIRDSLNIGKIKSRLGIQKEYFLTVGTLEPRKNFIRALKAFSRFKSETQDKRFQLVVAGSKNFAHSAYFEEHFKPFMSEDIVFTGYVSNEDLNELYSSACAFLFPSLYEGFGFPVLEAFSSGTAVLTSRATSLPEVAGEAALYVDPLNIDDITKGIKILAEDETLREKLVGKGLERVKEFSWEKTADETIKVYEELS